MQSPQTTQKGQLQGGSYSGQGGGHGHHGPRRLHKQGPSITTRHQHIQSANQGSHQPTQNKLISLLKDIKQTGGLSTHKYKQLYPTSAVPPNFMVCPKSIKQVHPSGPLFPVGGLSHMALPRSYHTSLNPL